MLLSSCDFCAVATPPSSSSISADAMHQKTPRLARCFISSSVAALLHIEASAGKAGKDRTEDCFKSKARTRGLDVQNAGWPGSRAAQQPRQILKFISKFLSRLLSACCRDDDCAAWRCLAGAPRFFSSSFSVTLALFSSIRLENLTVPSSEISTCGVVPRIPMVATGVSTFISPVLAMPPATKVNVPLERVNRVEFDFPFGSYTNSSRTMRALLDRLNELPSAKWMPHLPSAPVRTTSPR